MKSWIKIPEVVTSLVVAAITAVVAVAWHRSPALTVAIGIIIGMIAVSVVWYQRTKIRHRFAWSVIYDEPINQGIPSDDSKHASSGASNGAPSELAYRREMWNISYQSEIAGSEPIDVDNGSLVVIEMRNIGSRAITSSHFKGGKITCRFRGRKVVHYKIRDNPDYRDEVLADPSYRVTPKAQEYFELPAPELDPNEGLQVMVLLESKKPGAGPGDAEVEAAMDDAVIVRSKPLDWGLLRRWSAGVVAAALVLGGVIGVLVIDDENTPSPHCDGGSLNIVGSTAFAPIMNEAVTDYKQHCQDANITISAGGSVDGWNKFKKSASGSTMAMYDSAPPGSQGGQAVGVVVFAMVRNQQQSRPLTNYGMNIPSITSIFGGPGNPPGYHLVVRSAESGTKQVFDEQIDQADSTVNVKARCPLVGGPPQAPCSEDTTMDALSYIEKTPDTIGYAEADVVPFFPQVQVIPIDGQRPTRDGVLNQHYPFYATEHLYTKGASKLETDLINFLRSTAESRRLGSDAFIPCQDLGGSDISNACDASG